MEPLAPDWRTIGAAPAHAGDPVPSVGARAPRTIVLTPRHVVWIVGVLVATGLVGGAVFLALLPGHGEVVIDPGLAGLPASGTPVIASDTGTELVSSQLGELVVDVEGAVVHPGLIHVHAGGRVGDALAQAGGFGPNADLTRTASELNLAQQVTDGLKVVVPVMGQGAPGPGSAGASSTDTQGTGASRASGLVDLNHATEADLDSLPGVGPATIAKIVAARQASPFRVADDLRTRGIVGEAAFTRIRSLVTVGR
jgi:competence protein ComEA